MRLEYGNFKNLFFTIHPTFKIICLLVLVGNKLRVKSITQTINVPESFVRSEERAQHEGQLGVALPNRLNHCVLTVYGQLFASKTSMVYYAFSRTNCVMIF